MSPTAMSQKTPIMLLDEGNWNQWRTYLRGRLLSKGLWYLVEPAFKTPKSKPSHFRTPARDYDTADSEQTTTPESIANDGLALGILIQCISPSQFQYIEEAGTVADAYTALANHHEPKTEVDRLATLSDFYGMNWNKKQESLPQFLERYEIVLRRLRESGDAITNSTTVNRLLQLMPWELRHVTHQVTASKSFNADFSRVRALLETEYKAAVTSGALIAPRGASNDDRALNALHGNGRRDKQPKKGECHWCGKKGHWQPDCPAKAAGRPRKSKPYQANMKRETTSNQALDQDTGTFTVTIDGSGDDMALHVDTKAMRIIVDSGASSHMTGDASLLTDVVDCSHTVVVANGERARATKMGTMRVATSHGTTLMLTKVLLVEGMPHTLLSVAAIMRKNSRCRLTFNDSTCSIEHQGVALATGRLDATHKVFILELAPTMDHANVAAKTHNTPMTKSELWHHRAGHLPIAAINRCGALGLGTPDNLATPTTKCEFCVQAKMSKVSDTKGPMRTSSVGGCKYYTLYLDVATGYKIVRFVHSTDAATQLENWKKIMAWSKIQTGNQVKVFRSDGGSEYSSNDFEETLEKHGIHHESSVPDNQWQNGMAERAHRSLMEMAMAMLAHAGLAKRWWAEAVNTAAFIQNRVIHGPAASATPIHALTGHRAKLDKLRVFGCVAYNMVKDPTRRDKLAPKATKCVFMGYAEHQKAWKLYDLESNKMVTRVHITFSEGEFLGDRTKLDDYLVTTDDDDDDDEEVPSGNNEPRVKPPTSSDEAQVPPQKPCHFRSPQAIGLLDRFKKNKGGTLTGNDRTVTPSGMTLRPRSSLRPPSRELGNGQGSRTPTNDQLHVSENLDDLLRDTRTASAEANANMTINESHVQTSLTIDGIEFACSAVAPAIDVPQSHREAMASKDHDEWAKAEQIELKQLRDAGTWKLAELPPGRKSIGSRWTYAKKTNATSEVVRYKARLVCKGFSQVEGIDYVDTYSPVV
ncbi:hypothetical protein Ae201684P_012854 [Aphanomyces euteiches]|uniref:Integrase catalytic domain-containing protein n=1 Tax=Aphanomyces euteiches TaxID=100861 RepID=A0A6G0XGJ5_9STRA|nr:hypothetical protein Ae201684_005154 [Aphanomyces euteiches]KAH9080713.1 hypothetical protein Ae201684P_012854 [Aphanomyces euteiches]